MIIFKTPTERKREREREGNNAAALDGMRCHLQVQGIKQRAETEKNETEGRRNNAIAHEMYSVQRLYLGREWERRRMSVKGSEILLANARGFDGFGCSCNLVMQRQ